MHLMLSPNWWNNCAPSRPAREMHEIELEVKGLSYSQGKSGAYALILAEKAGLGRKLPIIIGGAEAQSIAVAMEKSVAPPRPLTHDTWFNTLNETGHVLEKVVIHRLVNGVFYASLYVGLAGESARVFDSRPSDAVALALRFESPICATSELMEAAAYTEEEGERAEKEPEMESVTPKPTFTRAELEERLAEAVANEDYELAARLRDQISKLK